LTATKIEEENENGHLSSLFFGGDIELCFKMSFAATHG